MNDINEQAAEKIVELGALLLEVLKKRPFIPSECGGDLCCYYCGHYDMDMIEHDDDCLYMRIKEAV
jgi:Na+-transporting NADH:ubiquinone oxidoreductase subunit NqrF